MVADITSEDTRVIDWLLAGDPAIRWQVMADLTDQPPPVVADERAKVATEGWGAELLSLQDPEGTWAHALYSPKWTSTTYTLLLLERLGLARGHPQAISGCRTIWDAARPIDGGFNLAKTVPLPEVCITAMLVHLAAAFGHVDDRRPATVEWLISQQLPDGGWNCESVSAGSRHGSFHTTIIVLESLQAHLDEGGPAALGPVLEEGRRFLLDHRLCRSHRTGEVVDPTFFRFPFPPQWHYDTVRALEHFRRAGVAPDRRMIDGIEAIHDRRRADGTWQWFAPYQGRYWFALERSGPGRWSTLRARRILRWWGDGPAA